MNKWNEETITNSIYEFIDQYGLNVMPTVAQLENAKRFDLESAITRYGGFKFWADKLKLKQTYCETRLGNDLEQQFIKDIFDNCCLKGKKMPTRFSYDILVNDNVKVDVKSAFLYHTNYSKFYTFNLEHENRKSDIIVAYCLNNDKTIFKRYIIPSIILQGKKQLSLGIKKSMYDKYLNRYDLIIKYNDFLNNIRRNDYG